MLELLKTKSFMDVAVSYGYAKGSSGTIMAFLKENGLDPRHYLKSRGGSRHRPKNSNWGCIGTGGQDETPAELTTIIDEQGRKITKCPTRYAIGATASNYVKPSQGGW